MLLLDVFSRRSRALLLAVLTLAGAISTIPPCVAQDFESVPQVKASDLLDPGWLAGEMHTVLPDVQADKALYRFTLKAGEETIEVQGIELLKQRIREVYATAALKKKLGVIASGKGLADEGISIGQTFGGALKKPIKTLVDIPRGFASIGKRSAGAAESKMKADGNYTGGALRDWYQISEYKLGVAADLGVDPYSDNEALQKQLTRLATSEAAGGIGLRVLIPGDSIVVAAQEGGSAAKLNDVYLTAPTQLYQENQGMLTKLGVGKEEVVKFLGSPVYSPADQSTMVRAISGMGKIDGINDYLAAAESVEDRAESYLFRLSTEMLKWRHDQGPPIVSLRSFGGFPVGITADKRLVVPIYLDHVVWSERAGGFIKTLLEFQAEQKCASTEVVTPGKISAKAKAGLAEKGIKVTACPQPGRETKPPFDLKKK